MTNREEKLIHATHKHNQSSLITLFTPQSAYPAHAPHITEMNERQSINKFYLNS